MALQYSMTSKLVNVLNRGIVANSMYVLAGAYTNCKLDPNLVAGDVQIVRMNNVTAEELEAGGTLPDGLSHTTAEIKVRVFGTAIKPTMLDKALSLGNWKDLVKEICPQVSNAMVTAVAIDDMKKIGEAGNMSVATGSNVWKRLANVSTDLQSRYTGNIYGFASPSAVAGLMGEGRSLTPVSVQPEFGRNLLGSIYAISQLRVMQLPLSVNAKNTSTVAATYVAGSTYSLSGVASAAFKKDEFIVTADGCVLYSYLDGTTQKWKCIKGGTWASTDMNKSFAPVICRCDGAEVFTNATDCIDGADGDTSDNVEGISLKLHKRPSGKSFEEVYEFGTGALVGIGDTAKARVLWCEVA